MVQYVRRHELVRAGDRVGLAVSGGADSVALLRLMRELRGDLGIGLCVLHFNHRLRGAESDADEQFVEELAKNQKLPFQSAATDVNRYAAEKGLSTEAAGRHLRYEYFQGLIRDRIVHQVATAHTLDDQAETVLLRMGRGAGTAGLAAIYPRVCGPSGSVIRPLLGVRRTDIETYLKQLNQPWREDASNRDLRHARNRVRHGILPRLERNLNPSIRESLADTAEIARAEEEYWASEVGKALPGTVHTPGVLSSKQLCALPLAVQRRVVRAAAAGIGLRLEFRHVEAVLDVCRGIQKSAPMPQGWMSARSDNGEMVHFVLQDCEQVADYQNAFSVPGTTEIPALGICLEAVLVEGPPNRYPAEHLFDAALLNKELLVRNWRAGDRFWPAHTKEPKKIKELLQDRHITGRERKLWPVVVSGPDVLWMRGFPCPEAWRYKAGAHRAVLIREIACRG